MQIFGDLAVRAALPAPSVSVQRIGSSLSPTVWRLGRHPRAARAIVLVDDGEAVLRTGEDMAPIDGPALAWLTNPARCRLELRAGSTGYILEIAEDLVARAAGDFSGPAMLGLTLERDLTLPVADLAPIATNIEAILGETQDPRIGSGTVISAHLRILLVAILRVSGLDDTAFEGSGAPSRFLQHFRQLVETNFRAHWPVARYAAAIGISHDRLHAICVRLLRRTPKALVAERLAREAGLGLEHSTLSIEELSFVLGFRDPAHFSHFFKRMTGIAPGAFRKRMAGAARDTRPTSPANFADWP
jgi:AraC family transcriptional activator of pobA